MSTRTLSTGPAAALATVLATAGLALLGPAAGADAASPSTAARADNTPGYTLRHIWTTVKVGPKRNQSCRIDADLYRPDRVNARHRAPAILTTHGFGGAKDDSNQSAIGRGFVKQGYVVLSYSGLGFGRSHCKIHLDDPLWDGRAGSQMLSVLAGTKTFRFHHDRSRHTFRGVSTDGPQDPRVGMIGGSYGGQIQYAVAEQDRRVDAIIPIITWNDLSYSLAPNNSTFRHGVTYRTPGVAKKQWIDLFFGDGIAVGAQNGDVDPTRNTGCPNFADRACTASAQLNTAGYPDQATLHLARHASVSTYVRRVKAPTLLVQGQNDTLFNLQESVATYRSLQAQGTPTKLVWQSWGHSGATPAPGELDFGAKSLRDSYLGRRFLNWMNHYVRGVHRAPTGPEFSYFRDWVKYDTSAANAGTAIRQAYATRRRVGLGPTASLFLSGSDALVRHRDRVQQGSASYGNTSEVPTSYSETSGVGGQFPPSDGPGTFAAFTTAPLAKQAVLVGSPRLTVHLESPSASASQDGGPAGHLVLFAKIYDVAPDGSVRLQHRLISPVRVGDVTKPVHIELPGVVTRFKAGHRIQVVLAASDQAYANNHLAQAVTVTTSQKKPSVLRLPLTSGLQLR